MFASQITLATPSVELRDSFLNGLSSLSSQSDRSSWIYLGESADLTLPLKDFDRYVAILIQRQTVAPAGFVCDTTYWATSENTVVGRISIRHELNASLQKVGGHIGFITHPAWRGNGVASTMLRDVLKTERARHIGKLLLTCDSTNIASERTIRKNGGLLAGVFQTGESQPTKKHFWIDLTTN